MNALAGLLETGARVKVGKTIDVGDAVSKSARMISERPLIMAPTLIILIPTLLGDLLGTSSVLSALRIITSILTLVFSVIASGAYPFLVKATLEGGQLSVGEALGKAYRRFWTLVVAGLLVGIIVVLGGIALVVPGIIFATWYVYTVPAIMLEDKGALEGMSASKAFGRDKKWKTFLIFLTFLAGYVVLAILDSVFTVTSPLLGEIVYAILLVPLGAWGSVIISYTYLTYGPAVTAATQTAGFAMAPPAPPLQPPVQASAPPTPPGNFCRFCGSPIRADSKFCVSCGKPV